MLTPQTPLSDGRYTLLEILGQGGMATVWRASDSRLGIDRAIKVLHTNLAARPILRKRFEREAQAMARLNHPNIVTVHDVLEERDAEGNRLLFIVMELMPKGSLTQLLQREGPLPPFRATGLVAQVLPGLGAAHEAGIIHRDLKPGNILLSAQDHPKVTDFGIAYLAEEGGLTHTGQVLGTYAYLAPEVRDPAPRPTVSSDIYAMGATLFALLTGREPFDLYAPQVRPEQFDGIPEPLVAVIRRATSYDPALRHASAAALRDDLVNVFTELPPTAARPSVAPGAPVPVASPSEPVVLPPEPLHPSEAEALPGRTTFVLTSDLRTGDRDIDQQHEQLFSWGYEILRDFDYPEMYQDLANGLRFLGVYVERHFEAEEALMASAGYPGLPVHRAAHEVLKREAEEILLLAETGGITPALRERMRRLLGGGLSSHIRSLDRGLATWLVAHPMARLHPIPQDPPSAADTGAWRRWIQRLKGRVE